jgi:hypothetical protein
MRPSDSPAASARLRSALGCALPVGQALFLCASTFPSRYRPPVRLPPTARRRGSPVLRRPDPPSGRSGVSQVTGSSSSAVPQSTTPPVSLRLALPSGFAHFGAAFLRPTRSPGYASTAPSREAAASLATSLLARLWLGGDRTHRTTPQSFSLHPQPPLRPALPGRFHDLPYFSGKHAGICRPNNRPKQGGGTQANQSPMNPAWFTPLLLIGPHHPPADSSAGSRTMSGP